MDLLSKLGNEDIKESDAAFFNKNLLPHQDLIFRCAYRLSGNHTDAEDLTQETFYYALKNYTQIKDLAKCKNWLFSILRNLFLKEVEKNKRHVDVNFDLVSHKVFSWVNQESEFLQGEVNGLIRKNLEKLDDRLKKPIELFYFESLSYKEIAKILGLPIGTVMSRIARAKVSLKRDLTRSEAFKAQRERFSDNGSKGKKS